MLHSVLNALESGVILLDTQQRVMLWNHWMERYSGLSSAQTEGRRLDEIFPEAGEGRVQQVITQSLSYSLAAIITPSLHHPLLPLYVRPQDREHHKRMQVLLHVIPLNKNMGYKESGCLLQISDMSATVKRERRLRNQTVQLRDASYRDSLTGVGNRRRFDEALAAAHHQAVRNQKPLSLVMVDIDYFKHYNDFYGHPKGDESLIRVAQALEAGLRQGGDQVCRYGGEEFAIILPNTDETAAAAIAERLRQQVENLGISHEASPVTHNVTISLGVSTTIPRPESAYGALITAADVALYHAKLDGRNRSMIFPMDDGTVRAC